MLEQVSSAIIQFVSSNGYLAVFFLMTLESALLPIPSEVTMPFAGFLVSQNLLNFWTVVTLGALANLTGSLIAYGIGFYLEENIILNLIGKFGKFILVSEHDYLRAVSWFQKYGSPIAFFSRLLPGVRTFISLPAGLSEMNLLKFSLYSFAGSFIWSTFLTYVGFALGKNWQTLEPYFRKFELLIGGVLILTVLWYLNRKLRIIKFFDKK